MSIFDSARKAIIEIPISDVLKERLSLAFDHATSLEKQVSMLQVNNAQIKAELKILSEDLKKKEIQLDDLQRLHEEDIRIMEGIEFRYGKRTNYEWLPFCPKCHLPARSNSNNDYYCSDSDCNWITTVSSFEYCIQLLEKTK